MYSTKLFKIAKSGTFASMFSKKTAFSESDIVFSLYEDIVKYANENDLDIVKLSSPKETLMNKEGIAVIFKTKN